MLATTVVAVMECVKHKCTIFLFLYMVFSHDVAQALSIEQALTLELHLLLSCNNFGVIYRPKFLSVEVEICDGEVLHLLMVIIGIVLSRSVESFY